MSEFVVFGSGGHSKVVVESVLSQGDKVLAIYDDAPSIGDYHGIPVIIGYQGEQNKNAKMLIAIGNKDVRRGLVNEITHEFGIAIHASSIVSHSVKIGQGTVVLHGAILQPCLLYTSPSPRDA